MSTGTHTGLPELWIDAPDGRHGHMEELTPAEAWELGTALVALADAAEKANPFRKALGKA